MIFLCYTAWQLFCNGNREIWVLWGRDWSWEERPILDLQYLIISYAIILASFIFSVEILPVVVAPNQALICSMWRVLFIKLQTTTFHQGTGRSTPISAAPLQVSNSGSISITFISKNMNLYEASEIHICMYKLYIEMTFQPLPPKQTTAFLDHGRIIQDVLSLKGVSSFNRCKWIIVEKEFCSTSIYWKFILQAAPFDFGDDSSWMLSLNFISDEIMSDGFLFLSMFLQYSESWDSHQSSEHQTILDGSCWL